MPWLVQRLARNTVVAVTPTAQVPYAARIDRAHAAATGVEARLAVPVIVGARVTYGLMIGSRQRHTDWRVPVIERLRLVGEILGAGLARVSQVDSPAVTRWRRRRRGAACAGDRAQREGGHADRR